MYITVTYIYIYNMIHPDIPAQLVAAPSYPRSADP